MTQRGSPINSRSAQAKTNECWAVTNGKAGNERQALALATCLPWPVRSLVVTPRAPWSWWAPRHAPGAHLAWPAGTLAPPWPRLVIGCGREAALFTRLVRQLSDRTCPSVQILNPRIDPRHWDLVIAPRHDQLQGANVLNPLGSLNPVDDAWLADGRSAWTHLDALPAPRLGVLLGGPRHGVTTDPAYPATLAAAILARHQHDGGSVMLLASRRTPAAWMNVLCSALGEIPGMRWRDDDDGVNPYPGVLGWADRLVVTGDSVNMLSEACACGCPVHTLTPTAATGKIAHFHTALRARGLLHDIDADTAAHQPPLRETRAMADAMCERLGLDMESPRQAAVSNT
ncbi:MAG TPA: mitochondrial fission ELM1 family protein [Oleiagrimonas sp.]|nr:mitochondrial fission ELM1 family protein [Oleiagrimonas sp.]